MCLLRNFALSLRFKNTSFDNIKSPDRNHDSDNRVVMTTRLGDPVPGAERSRNGSSNRVAQHHRTAYVVAAAAVAAAVAAAAADDGIDDGRAAAVGADDPSSWCYAERPSDRTDRAAMVADSWALFAHSNWHRSNYADHWLATRTARSDGAAIASCRKCLSCCRAQNSGSAAIR